MSTPIGNLGDITVRALEVLGQQSHFLCEDTRKTGILLNELEKRYPQYFASGSKRIFTRFDDFYENKRLPEIINELTGGANLVLVSDAGTPLICDPGFPLVRECHKRQIPVIPVPGVSAVITALSASGIPAYPFQFLGYPPKSASHRKEWFNVLKQQRIMFPKNPMTSVFYSSPYDLPDILSTMFSVAGDIEITVARELTKIHEEFWTGTVSSALEHFRQAKGEFVILTRFGA